MEKVVKILLLEDNTMDAELVHHQVKKSGIKFKWLHVSEYDTFVDAIGSFNPDIILSDYNLLGFTGMDALELAKQKCPLIPFIIVTGTIDEETAAETIKKGAWDYIVKERLIRLDSAILNALKLKEEKAERILAINRLKEQEQKLRSITETANDAIITINNKGIIDGWNKAAEKIFGYLAAEMIDKELTALIPEFYRIGHSHGIELLYNGGAEKIIGKTIELIALRKNGTEFPIDLSLSSWTVNDQKYYTGMIHDITDRKLAEKELIKLSTAVKQSPSVIAITDIKGNLQYTNPKFTEVTGYTFEEVRGLSSSILKSGELQDEFYKELWRTIIAGKEWRGELHNKHKNGELFWEAASISAIQDKTGKIISYLKVSEDITQRKLGEKEMNKRIIELEIFNEASVDREIMINELRKEVNEMLRAMKKSEKYKIFT